MEDNKNYDTKDTIKNIALQKRSRFLFYDFGEKGNEIFKKAWPLSLSLLLTALVAIPYFSKHILLIITFGLISIISAIVVTSIEIRKTKAVQPYKGTKHFSSIYAADDLVCDGTNNIKANNQIVDLTMRECEANYISSRLCNIAKQKEEKNLMLLSGESGSGKSTVLWWITRFNCEYVLEKTNTGEVYVSKNKNAPLFRSYRFSLQYSDLRGSLLKQVGPSMGLYNVMFQSLNELIDKMRDYLQSDEWDKNNKNGKKRPFIMIFDQFENFFILPEKDRQIIFNEFFQKLDVENIAVIFAIRSDRLSSFLSEFNFVLQNQDKESNTGIVSVFKNGVIVHNENYDENNSVLLFTQSNNAMEKEKLEKKCSEIIVHKSCNIYELIENSVMIEQQLIGAVFEYDSNSGLEEFYERKNIDLILNRYFDRQLCSTGNYYEALQIMYLIASGRKANKLCSTEQIKSIIFYADKTKRAIVV